MMGCRLAAGRDERKVIRAEFAGFFFLPEDRQQGHGLLNEYKMRDVKYLRLREEIKPYLKVLREASKTIRDQDVSDYPIFVFYQQDVEIGILLVDRAKVNANWSVNASTLEEFVARQLIEEERVAEFKKHYQDPDTHFCLFVLSELGADFIFVPHELTLDN